MLALFDGFVTPDVAGFLRSIDLVAMVVVGGIGSSAGSIVGAALLVTLPQLLTVFVEYEQIVLGLIIMLVIDQFRYDYLLRFRPEFVAGGFNLLLGGASFALHYFAWRRRDLRLYLQEAEFRTYIAVIGLTALVIALYLAVRHSATPGHALLAGLFQAVSIGTTSGFVREPSSHWPAFVQVLMLFVSFIGACANSTGAGLHAVLAVAAAPPPAPCNPPGAGMDSDRAGS